MSAQQIITREGRAAAALQGLDWHSTLYAWQYTQPSRMSHQQLRALQHLVGVSTLTGPTFIIQHLRVPRRTIEAAQSLR